MTHLAPLIRDLAIILGVAGLVTLLFQWIKQPVVLGYIFAGIIVGPHTPPYHLVSDIPNVKTLAELGVIFLMFSLGLEFSFRKLARVGVTASFTAGFEVVIMLALGFGTGRLMGWSPTDSIFLGAMLSISSTTIIIKALDELGLKTARFAELIFGALVVEDLAAILILVSLSSLVASGGLSGAVLATSSAKLVLVVGTWVLAGYFVVPRFVRFVGKFRSDEMLTVVSLGLCLLLVVLAASFHYSVALGAFIMGSILAESTESHRIEDLMKPLRDIFAAIFFVSVGMLMDPHAIWEHKGVVIIVTIVTIVGKIFSTSLGTLVSGQKLKTSLHVGFGLAQIGEFSFIIATLGLSLGVMSEFLYPVTVAVSLITTFTTPYFIRLSPRVADAVEKILPAKVTQFLERYVAWRAQRSSRRARGPDFNRRATKWLINGFVITLINVVIANYGMPFLESQVSNSDWAHAIGWSASILLSAPFVWGMLVAFPNQIASQILTLVWLGVLSLAYFRARYVGLVTATMGVFLFTRLYRQLESSYRWFEESFLANFAHAEKSGKPQDIYKQLAPWDGHLVRIKVDADSEVSGKRLAEIELRKKFGLNVVAIQRGSKAIVAPKADQQIFPKDELLVLGTDENIEIVRRAIEEPPQSFVRHATITGYELRPIFVGEMSPLLGRDIRQSGIREKFDAMVVGIERRGRRIMNPDSHMVIEIEDLLWVVGEASRLDALNEYSIGSAQSSAAK